MRFHVLAIPHTATNHEYSACAFTQKVLKFCAMMTERGHHVIHYGHERSEVKCTEHVTVTNDYVLNACYGKYNFYTQQFKHCTSDEAHQHFYKQAIIEVGTRKATGDFLLAFWGVGHAPITSAHSDMIVVEPGIGSFSDVSTPFSVFESYAVMHHNYGKYGKQPRFFDCVIPNYFDHRDFIDASSPDIQVSIDAVVHAEATQRAAKRIFDKGVSSAAPEETLQALDKKQDGLASMDTVLKLPAGKYVVVIARIIQMKGIQLAIEACEKAGMKVVFAGQGSLSDAVSEECKYSLTSPEDPTGVTHIGYVTPRVRAVLIARSYALLLPSLYTEPFGGVNVEAQMSGIPVITTDWGGFTETVVHGVTGYRCRCIDHFVWAIKNAGSLNKKTIRDWAVSNYGFQKVGSMFEEYFSMLSTTYRNGFYQENPGRLGLSWLEKRLTSPATLCVQPQDPEASQKDKST